MICLSIQSGVVAGHVGLGAALPVLVRAGFEVWPLPTVLISNHAGTPGVARAQGYGVDGVRALIAGLEASGALDRVDAVLTGYLASAEVAEAVAELVEALSERPEPPFLFVDPVLGDDGRLYLPDAVGDVLRDTILPRADAAAPNVTELGWLTGRPTGSVAEIEAAARALGPHRVFVTSVRDGDQIGILSLDHGTCALAQRPIHERRINGAGDALSADLLARLTRGASAAEAAKAALDAFDIWLDASADRDDLALAAPQSLETSIRGRT
ncbi:MAG: PfkB family carbohydrate kinase [Pseudomonadota bacterium]